MSLKHSMIRMDCCVLAVIYLLNVSSLHTLAEFFRGSQKVSRFLVESDPRLVLEPSAFKFRRSLKQAIKKQGFEIRTNTQFEMLIRLCASTRENDEGTWITEEMIQAYMALHREGCAVSFETFRQDELVGGLYGVKLGQVLFGESMVSLIPDASKAALASLYQEIRAPENSTHRLPGSNVAS